MINHDYANIVEQARTQKSTVVNFDQNVAPVSPITAQQDTLSLSKEAQALMAGYEIKEKEVAPTYIRPETARSILAENSTPEKSYETSESDKSRFDEIMQATLDKRLGIDRERLKEIDAMIEEIGKNENLSPEEKEEAIEMLQKVKEEIIKESIELKEVSAQTDTPETDDKTF